MREPFKQAGVAELTWILVTETDRLWQAKHAGFVHGSNLHFPLTPENRMLNMICLRHGVSHVRTC